MTASLRPPSMPLPAALDARVEAVWHAADAAALQAMREAGFVLHNVPLSATEGTIAGVPFIGESPRTVAIHESLRRFAGADLGGRSALDLGCLEGGHSFELRRAGLDVLGVEGRTGNFERCLRLRDYYRALGGIEFVLADVRAFEPHRRFDVVVCSGLLYHLDDPMRFIGRLGELIAPGGMLYLDTHVAPEESFFADCEMRGALSAMKVRDCDGLAVRYREFDEDVRTPEASIGNAVSLWLDTDSHLELLQRAGFGRVFELNGYFGPGEQALKRRYARRHFVALKQA